MTVSYEGKVVVITGASAGIGAALAEELGRRKAKLALVARRRELLLEVAARAGGAEVFPADVTRKVEIEQVAAAALARFGRIDFWLNNAGRAITRSLQELDDDDIDAMVRINVKSALYGMQAVLPHFKERGSGVLGNVSSMLARIPSWTQRSAYSAAKAALNSFTETLRFELAGAYPGIRVVLIVPGPVATDFGSNSLGGAFDSRAIPGGQIAEDVARIVADGLPAGPVDLYTRPDGLERSLAHLRALGG